MEENKKLEKERQSDGARETMTNIKKNRQKKITQKRKIDYDRLQ